MAERRIKLKPRGKRFLKAVLVVSIFSVPLTFYVLPNTVMCPSTVEAAYRNEFGRHVADIRGMGWPMPAYRKHVELPDGMSAEEMRMEMDEDYVLSGLFSYMVNMVAISALFVLPASPLLILYVRYGRHMFRRKGKPTVAIQPPR